MTGITDKLVLQECNQYYLRPSNSKNDLFTL